jgi:hypothetical protein
LEPVRWKSVIGAIEARCLFKQRRQYNTWGDCMARLKTIGIRETTYQLLKTRQLHLIAMLKKTNITLDFVIQELIHHAQTTQPAQAKPEYNTYKQHKKHK